VSATAAADQPESRQPSGEKVERMVDAARASIAELGITGATFDQVAKAAGVSRGLLHYYFGSKERLLVKVVRRESELRVAALERAIGEAASADAVLAALVHSFEDLIGGEGPTTVVMTHEMITLAQRNTEIAAEIAELGRQTRTQLAQALRAKAQDGVLRLQDSAETVASFLLVLADGLLVRRLSEPDYDIRPVMDEAVAAARTLL
jgi:AcrR family transcriptional regulator